MTTPGDEHNLETLTLAWFAEREGLEVGTASCDDGSEIRPVRTEDRAEPWCSACGRALCVGRNRTHAFWTHMGEEVHVPPGVWDTLEVVHW